MKGRMFSPEIRKSKNFAKLNFYQRDLFHGLIESCADDQGRMLADPHVIKAAVWTWDDISIEQVQSDLDVLAGGKFPFILFYDVDEVRYIQVIKWWKWQQGMSYASPSLYPAPAGWTDRIKINTKGNKPMIINWDKTGGFASENNIDGQVPTLEPTQDPTLDPAPEGTKVKDVNSNKNKTNEKVKENFKDQQIKFENKPGSELSQFESDLMFWDEAKGILQRDISKAMFDTWIQPLIFTGRSGNQFKVQACNQHGRDWVHARAGPILERILAGLVGEPVVLVVRTKFEDLAREKAR
jgi:hypothetical protein